MLLQFEDFAQQTAMPLLTRYRDEICCFNDDIQGTAAVTLGCLMAASQASQRRLCDQTVVFLGADLPDVALPNISSRRWWLKG